MTRDGTDKRVECRFGIHYWERDLAVWVVWYHMEQVADMQFLPSDFLVNMSASADVLAQAKVEIGLATIPEGKNVRAHFIRGLRYSECLY